MLLRIGKRKESFANRDIEEVIDTEFTSNGQPDLAISTYDIDDLRESIIRAHAEHVASLDQDPRGRQHLDLTGIVERAEATPGEGKFSYTNAAHRELRFASLEELVNALGRLVEEFTSRTRQTQKSDVKSYCRQRVAAQDEEWLKFLRESENAAAWR